MTPPDAAALPDRCDLLVVGSGAGALSVAVTAAHRGLEVVVVEKAARFGGTTAWSGGWMWVPRNPLALAAGIDEPLDEVRRYLRAIVGEAYDTARTEAYLAAAPEMLRFHLQHTALRFIDGNAIPDFHGQAPGARTGGRSVCAAPFDARRLGAHLHRLEPPAAWLSFLGIGIGGGADLRHFLRATRSLDSFLYVARRIARHAADLPRYRRGTLLMGGNALAGALLASALERGVRLFESCPARALTVDDSGRVTGARVATPGGERTVSARRGVLLACGGFPHDAARQAALFPHVRAGGGHWSAAPATNTGDGLALAEAAGARLAVGADAGAWAPVSLLPRRDGGFAHFPHLVERGKPGLIAVTADGQRFADEAGNYHTFMRGLFAACAQRLPGRPVEAWLVVDHRFQRRYGLGHSKPWPVPLAPWLANGYLERGRSVAELAAACGIAPAGLARTVSDFNRHAARGEDPEFGRGSTPYDRLQGDAEHGGPNPCVAPLDHAPYYAVRIVPGSLGTFAGIATDAHGRALDARGAPIAGLYAAGNDAASVMGGHYPSGGITLGPAMTFGWLAAQHAAGQPFAPPVPPPAAQGQPSTSESTTA